MALNQEPVILKDKKVYFYGYELCGYEDANITLAYLSPDKQKLMILDQRVRRLHIIHIEDITKMQERIKTIPLEKLLVSVCWFSDSERIAIAYPEKL